MEKNYKRVPFDIELAKKIQSGEVEGKVITSSKKEVTIIKTNALGDFPIVGLVQEYPSLEIAYSFSIKGVESKNAYSLSIELPEKISESEPFDQIIPNPNHRSGVMGDYRFATKQDTEAGVVTSEEVPKHEFKVGGIVYIPEQDNKTVYIIKKIIANEAYLENPVTSVMFSVPLDSIQYYDEYTKEESPKCEFEVGDYVQYGEGSRSKEKLKITKIDESIPNNIWIECSTIDGDISIKCPISEVRPYELKHEFKPFDKVLVSNNHPVKEWIPAFYQKISEDGLIFASGQWYSFCIPYEGNEHLVGKTNKPKEE